MQFRRQLREEESINLTPLIDVVFLLLIFFMVSTTFTKETHLSIDLPEASGEHQAESPKAIEIIIAAEGSYAINGSALVNREIETLRAALKSMSASDDGDAISVAASTPLIITADAKAPHEYVVRAMDAAGQLGFVQLSITTRNTSSDTQ